MKSIFLVGLLAIAFHIHAQTDVVDSLNQVLRSNPADTQKCVIYYEIVKTYYAKAQLEELIPYLHEKQLEIGNMLKPGLKSKEKQKIWQHLGLMFYTEALTDYRLARLEDAWVQADTALIIFQKIKDYQFLAGMYNVCGILCQYQSLTDSALFYYRKCYETAVLIPDTGLMIKSTYNQAGIFKRQQQYEKAIELYLQVGELGRASNDKMAIGDSHKGLGDVYYYISQHKKAIDEYSQAITLFETLNDLHGLNNALSNIAIIYKEQGEYKAALRNYRRVLAISKSQKNQKSEADDYLSIGAVYGEMGAIDSAKYYYRKGLNLHTKVEYKPGIAMSYANLGNKLVASDSIKEGLNLLEKSVVLYRELADDYNLIMVLSLLANAELELGKLAKAAQHAQEAYALSVSLNLPEGILSSSGTYAKVLNKKGDYKEAYHYLEINKNYQDSLRNKELRNNAIRSDLELEYQRKTFNDSIENERQRHLQELQYQVSLGEEEEKRTILYFLAFAALLVAVGFYSRYVYIARSKKVLQKEKDRSDNLLLNILPAEVAEELKEKGKSEARDFDNVTVLFTDFVEFTQTAANLSAKELVSEINSCFEAFDDIITKHKLEKIKTIGDAYMAAGGLHVPRTSDPKDVVEAAIEMQEFMLKRKAEREAQNLPAFDMRVGIHTGPVVAGIVGVKKFQYDIWGDTVNTASRMESSGAIGKVNISQATYELLKDDPQFRFESRGKVDVKGKGEMEMWFVKIVSS